ncbi:MAG: methyltransferase domain-containing protein [Rhodospirillales bacterium]|nr:methyltransferase domain-containing protein [Rhodospirillales bacterium]
MKTVAVSLDVLFKQVSDALARSDLPGACALLDEILSMTPRDKEARHLAARLCRALGEKESAITHYQLCLEHDSSDEVAKFGLSVFGIRPRPDRVPDSILCHVFDRNASHYEENMASLGYKTPELLAGLLKKLPTPPSQAITLDLGCGTGLNGFYLKPMSRRIVGVDIAPQMLKIAAKKGIYDQLVAAEIETFIMETQESFDLIAATNVLMYFGQLENVLEGIGRLLSPNGLLAFDLERSEVNGTSDFVLEPVGGRFAHSPSYVGAVLEKSGMHSLVLEESVMRHEKGMPVTGLFIVARKS